MVEDGNTDLDGIESAIAAAKAETEKPSLIVMRTHIAYGSPNKQDTAGAHGAPLGTWAPWLGAVPPEAAWYRVMQ